MPCVAASTSTTTTTTSNPAAARSELNRSGKMDKEIAATLNREGFVGARGCRFRGDNVWICAPGGGFRPSRSMGPTPIRRAGRMAASRFRACQPSSGSRHKPCSTIWHMATWLGARHSYREAARLLEMLLPCGPVNHATMRNRTHRVAADLEAAVSPTPESGLISTDMMMVIDGAHIRAAHGHQSRHIDVTVGKIEVAEKPPSLRPLCGSRRPSSPPSPAPHPSIQSLGRLQRADDRRHHRRIRPGPDPHARTFDVQFDRVRAR